MDMNGLPEARIVWQERVVRFVRDSEFCLGITISRPRIPILLLKPTVGTPRP
jgi:hypothetical protein